MNGTQKVWWALGALSLAGGAAWYYFASSGEGSDTSDDGDGTGDPSVGGGQSSVASAYSSATQVLTQLGASIGIVPKGVRNNNPGNIRYVVGIPWKGQTGDDGTGYAVFDSAEDGVRALGHQLNTYMNRGLTTVNAIISTWAPNNENNTAAYIADVAGRLGVDPNQPLGADSIPALAQAIIIHENGYDPYGMDSIAAWSTEP